MKVRRVCHAVLGVALMAAPVRSQEETLRWWWSPGLGLYFSTINRGLALDLGLENTKGLLVLAVVRDGAADRAGVKPGDVVAGLSSQDILSEDGVRGTVEVVRDGRARTLEVQSRKLPDDAALDLLLPVVTARRPATLVVDPAGAGRFRTLTGALFRVVPGDSVVLNPGGYDEGVMVPPGVTIRAAEKSLVHVDSQTPWIVISSKAVNISEIDFSGGGLNIQGAENVAISMCGFTVPNQKAGLIVMNSRTVSVINSSFRGATETVGVSAKGSSVSITGSVFSGHGTAGIVLAGGARGDVRNNLLEGNSNGILGSDSELTATRNIISGAWNPDSKDERPDFGIRLEKSTANLTKNSIRRHRYGLMVLHAPSPAKISGNVVTQGQHGIILLDTSGTVSDNLIIQNQGDGIEIARERPWETQEVDLTRQDFVTLTTPQEVRLLRNTVSENEASGIYVERFSHGHASMRENLIEANGTGIRLEESAADIENNTVVLQHSAGLRVGAHSDAVIYNNILASNSFGLFIDVTARHETDNNDVYGNLAWAEFPLMDGNYARVDRYTTRDAKKVLIAVYPAYDLKVESDVSVDPGFVNLGGDYHLKRDSALVGIRGREHRYIGAYPPPGVAPARWPDELFETDVQDAFFDYGRSELRPDAEQVLRKTAEFLRTHSQIRLSIEGHCDERGSTEYNLALGERRAQAVKNYLETLGISSDRMGTTSWGKERPFCTESDETCWQQNRRAHFVMIHSAT